MKKSILLIILLLLSLNIFSQTDTKQDSIVPLKAPIARLVIKDLIAGDGAKAQLHQTNLLLSLSNQKLQVKDSIISTLDLRIFKLESNITFKDQQFTLQQELSKKLQQELKTQKTKTFLYQIGTGLGVITTLILLSK
jgi:hypothetical protein